MATEHLQRHLAKAQSLNAYYLGTGDYVDLASPSNRARFAAAQLYDTAEEIVRDKARELVDILYSYYLSSTQGRWLGLVHGHHWFPISATEITDQRLAYLLDAPYLGTCAFVVLDFVDEGSNRHGQVKLWVHHGRGNGKASAPIRVLQSLAGCWEADIFIIGHMTKLAAAAINRVYPKKVDNHWELDHSKILLVGAGGWSKAYTLGHRQNGRSHGCYVEEAMLDPAALGGPIITIETRWDSRRWCPELTVEV